MKQISLIVNLFLLGIIFFQACGSNKTDASLTHNEQPLDSCTHIFCRNYSDSLFNAEISFKTARALSLDYRLDSGKKYIWKKRLANRDSLDATSIWFGIDVLKKFIWQIETTSCRMGCNEKLGVRFYYARYPSAAEMKGNPDFRGVRTEYANRHTLFMVPTFYDATKGKYVDFDLRAERCGAVFDTTIQKPLEIVFGFGLAGRSLENHGGVAPPPPTDGLFPTY